MKKNLLLLALLTACIITACNRDPRHGKSYDEVLSALVDSTHINPPYFVYPEDSTVLYLHKGACYRRQIYTDQEEVVWDLGKEWLTPYFTHSIAQYYENNAFAGIGEFIVGYKWDRYTEDGGTETDLLIVHYNPTFEKVTQYPILYENGFYSGIGVQKDIRIEEGKVVIETMWSPSPLYDKMLGGLYRRITLDNYMNYSVGSDITYMENLDYGFYSYLAKGADADKNLTKEIYPDVLEKHFIYKKIDCLHPSQYLIAWQENKMRFNRNYRGDYIAVEGCVKEIEGLLYSTITGTRTLGTDPEYWETFWGYWVNLQGEYIGVDDRTHTFDIHAYIPKSRTNEVEQLSRGDKIMVFGELDINKYGNIILDNATTTPPRRSRAEAERLLHQHISFAP